MVGAKDVYVQCGRCGKWRPEQSVCERCAGMSLPFRDAVSVSVPGCPPFGAELFAYGPETNYKVLARCKCGQLFPLSEGHCPVCNTLDVVPPGVVPARPGTAPGVKLDCGKVDMTFLRYFPRALEAVCRVSEFGAKKYTRDGWLTVENGEARYDAAMLRHAMRNPREPDKESGLPTAAHTAWNALAVLELMLQEQEKIKR